MNLTGLPLNIPAIERDQETFETLAKRVDMARGILEEIKEQVPHPQHADAKARWSRIMSDSLLTMETKGFFVLPAGQDPNPRKENS